MEQEFWDLLSRYNADNVFNPWASADPNDVGATPISDRIRRLMAHLDCDAKYILIGEAPGHRGCRFSGVPFTSEWQYVDSRIAGPFAGKRITTFNLPLREASATIVYRTLDELGITDSTIMWNAFPWHPHAADLPYTNRTPTPREVLIGAPILARLLYAFPGVRVIAVGQIAKRLLNGLGIQSTLVRHPSMGGASAFKQQMVDLTRERA